MSTERSLLTAKACVFLTSLVVVFGPQGRCAGQNTSPGTSSERRSESDDVAWEPVPAAQVIPTLEMLAGQCTGNLQRLVTWEGSFNCTLTQKVSKSSLPPEIGRELRANDGAYVLAQMVFDVDFAADLENNRLFNAKKTAKSQYVNEQTGKQVLSRLKAYDEYAVFTQEHFVHFAPNESWGLYVKSGDGKKPHELHKGTREAPIKSRIDYNLNIVNPSGFFGFSPARKFGEELALLREAYSGKHGREFQQLMRDHLKLFTSASPAGRRYRLDVASKQSSDAPARLDYMRMIFLPETGYNPTSFVIDADVDGGLRRPRVKAEWSWRSTDGIFLPSRFVQAIFIPATGALSYELTLVLGRSTINPRLDDSRFSYEALGMVNGDWLDDEMTKSRYTYRDGKLEKFASGDIRTSPDSQEQDETVRNERFFRTRMMLAVSVMVGGLFVFGAVRAKRRRVAPAP